MDYHAIRCRTIQIKTDDESQILVVSLLSLHEISPHCVDSTVIGMLEVYDLFWLEGRRRASIQEVNITYKRQQQQVCTVMWL